MDFLTQITMEHFFIACASIGGALFVVRILVWMFAGDDGDGDVDGEVDSSGADASFKLLSLQGITEYLHFLESDQPFLLQRPDGCNGGIRQFGEMRCQRQLFISGKKDRQNVSLLRCSSPYCLKFVLNF